MATLNEPCSSKLSDKPSQSTEDKGSATQQAHNRHYTQECHSPTFAEFQHALDELKMAIILFEFSIAKLGKTEKRSGKKIPVVTEFEYTYYSVRCVHYGEARSLGKGLCPDQRHFPMGCQAKITASYNKLQNKIVVRV